ncbi:MAG: redoxin domain-containing protein [bacterium]|nr:redoxin domain-containing protein [bacterium]
MSKQNIYLIVGVVGFIGLIAAGIFLFQGKGEEPGNIINNGMFRFDSAVGQKAPDFTLPDMEGNQVTLSSFLGKNVILFFNEGLMCYPACLDQVVELNKLNADNTVAFSIVVDASKQWVDAQKDLPYLKGAKVLFDAGAKVSRQYDTLTLASSMHRGMFPGHTYYLIDKEGIVRYTLDDPRMANRNKELAAALLKLQ